jgi:hypothetical protein
MTYGRRRRCPLVRVPAQIRSGNDVGAKALGSKNCPVVAGRVGARNEVQRHPWPDLERGEALLRRPLPTCVRRAPASSVVPRVPSKKNSARTGILLGTAVQITEEPLSVAPLAILVEMVLAGVVAQASLEWGEPPALLKARTR